MADGVSLVAPETVFFSHDTALARDVLVEPNVVFGPGVRDAQPEYAEAHAQFVIDALRIPASG